MPDEVVLDIQAFTQGIVGDVNAICCAALDAIAARSTGSNRQPKVTRALLKEAGATPESCATTLRRGRSPSKSCRRKPCT